MRCISIWQPFASLLVQGHKIFETRTWPAPPSLVGERVGIASTKNVVPGQRAHWNDPKFQEHYDLTGLPDLLDLPMGYLIGTAVLDEVLQMDPDVIADVSEAEQNFGWWEIGNYAWRMIDPVALDHPIPIRGMQGLYTWKGDLSGHAQNSKEESQAPD